MTRRNKMESFFAKSVKIASVVAAYWYVYFLFIWKKNKNKKSSQEHLSFLSPVTEECNKASNIGTTFSSVVLLSIFCMRTVNYMYNFHGRTL